MKKNLSLEKIKDDRRKSRLDKIATLIKKAVAEILLKLDFNDSDGKNILLFVSNVTLSADGKSAIVYVESIQDQPTDWLFDLIQINSVRIKKLFSSKINLRYTPKLKFEISKSQKLNSK